MILTEDLQLQLLRQSAFGTAPGTPNGILLPRGSNFTLEYDQKLIDDVQIFADAVEREPGLGNKTSGMNGDLVPNLSFFPVLQEALCGNLAITGSSAPYTLMSSGISRTVPYYMAELGVLGWALPKYYRWFDLMLSEFHLDMKIEGKMTVGTKWAGTGNVAFPPVGTSIDTTPTELAGPSLNYCDVTNIENADASAGDIVEVKLDVTRKVVEKRVSGSSGVATQLRAGKSQVRLVVTCFWESDARWARARAGTITQVQATAVDNAANSMVMLTTEVKLQPTGPKIEGADGVMQEFAAVSFRKTNTVDTPVKFTTINQLGVTA
jgi:hypothetical protein